MCRAPSADRRGAVYESRLPWMKSNVPGRAISSSPMLVEDTIQQDWRKSSQNDHPRHPVRQEIVTASQADPQAKMAAKCPARTRVKASVGTGFTSLAPLTGLADQILQAFFSSCKYIIWGISYSSITWLWYIISTSSTPEDNLGVLTVFAVCF